MRNIVSLKSVTNLTRATPIHGSGDRKDGDINSVARQFTTLTTIKFVNSKVFLFTCFPSEWDCGWFFLVKNFIE